MDIPEDALAHALEVGRAARELLNTPALATAFQSLQTYHTEAMVATKEGPAGDDLRAHHHRMIYALHEVLGDLHQRAQVGAEAEQRLAEDEQEDRENVPEE